jgi:hypothetical protein
MGLVSAGLTYMEPCAALSIQSVRQPSRQSLISRDFLKGATAEADVRRRIKHSKSNHLHPDRRRCFNLAILFHSSSRTLTDTEAEVVNLGGQAHSISCRAALHLLMHVYGCAVDMQPICYTAVPERIAH